MVMTLPERWVVLGRLDAPMPTPGTPLASLDDPPMPLMLISPFAATMDAAMATPAPAPCEMPLIEMLPVPLADNADELPMTTPGPMPKFSPASVILPAP